MATKAEHHRADEQRDNQRRNESARAARRERVDHKQGVSGTARRNLKTSPSHQKGGPALESSATGQPSRKSTRGSAGRVKLATNLQRRQIRRTHSSKSRAGRAAVR